MLEAQLEKLFNKKDFSLRFALFEKELKNIPIEFPYLDVFKKQLIWVSIMTSSKLKDEDKVFLTLFHTLKNDPNGGAQFLNEELELKFSKLTNNVDFNLRLVSFEKELRRNKIEFPYFDVLKKRQVDYAIEHCRHLSSENKTFLALYHKGMNRENEISDAEKKALSAEMIKKLNNKEFIQALYVLDEEMKLNHINFPHLDTLIKYSYGIEQAQFIDGFIDKLQHAIDMALLNEEISDEKKLSVADLGWIAKIIDLNKCISILEKEKNIPFEAEKHYKLKLQCAQIQVLNKMIDTFYDLGIYQSGDILVTIMDITQMFQSQLEYTTPDVCSKGHAFNVGKGLLNKYGHASQLAEIKGDLKQSHMWGKHQIDPFVPENVLHSEIFRVNISKLVEVNQEEALKEILGEDWQQNLQALFAEKVAEVSQKTALEKARIISGTNAIPALFPHWYGRQKEDSHQGLLFHENGAEGLYKDKMICSDFVAREIVEAIFLVNQSLQMRSNGKDLSNPIKSPFPSYCNFSRITPDELIKLLKESGCIDKVEQKKLKTLITLNPKAAQTHRVTKEYKDRLQSHKSQETSDPNLAPGR